MTSILFNTTCTFTRMGKENKNRYGQVINPEPVTIPCTRDEDTRYHPSSGDSPSKTIYLLPLRESEINPGDLLDGVPVVSRREVLVGGMFYYTRALT